MDFVKLAAEAFVEVADSLTDVEATAKELVVKAIAKELGDIAVVSSEADILDRTAQADKEFGFFVEDHDIFADTEDEDIERLNDEDFNEFMVLSYRRFFYQAIEASM